MTLEKFNITINCVVPENIHKLSLPWKTWKVCWYELPTPLEIPVHPSFLLRSIDNEQSPSTAPCSLHPSLTATNSCLGTVLDLCIEVHVCFQVFLAWPLLHIPCRYQVKAYCSFILFFKLFDFWWKSLPFGSYFQ